jgi:hypothetical protein
LSAVELEVLKSPQTAGQANSDFRTMMPPFHPNKGYYELYWELYLQNEQLMKQVEFESMGRDDLLTNIVQIETFYCENLEKL